MEVLHTNFQWQIQSGNSRRPSPPPVHGPEFGIQKRPDFVRNTFQALDLKKISVENVHRHL